MIEAGTLQGLPRVLTVDEAAMVLRISRSAAFRAVHEGTIPTVRVGRSLRVPTHRLLELLDAGGIQETGD